MNYKKSIIKDGYSVGVSCSNGEKVLWKVVDNHVVEEVKEPDEVVQWGFGFNFFDED